MRKSGIYKITNLINGKIYIGSSCSLSSRSRAHYRSLRCKKHFNILLQHAVNKYGIENFQFDIIEFVYRSDQLFNREQYYLDLYKSYNRTFGYNISDVAVAPINVKGFLGHHHSVKSKAKISQTMCGIQRSTATKQKMSRAKKGRVVSAETRQKLSMSSKGRNLGKKWSFSHREKIAITLGARPFQVFQKETGEFIGEWLVQAQCARDLTIDNSIINSCLKGIRRSTGGYTFRYSE